jgi:hypothetical protein
MTAVEGQVNLDDLLSSTAGGVIRVKNNAAVTPLTVQSSAAQSFPMMEYMDTVQAKRTGVSDMQQGLDPSVLQNTTATAVAAVMQQSAGKLELMARVFAETGVKSLFRGILHLLCAYQNKKKTIRISGKWIDFDPREWNNLYDVSINVGLGNGNRQEQIAMLQMILSKQEQIIQQYGMSNPLVDLKQYRETLDKLIQMAGFKDTSSFMHEITPEQSQQIAQQAQQSQGQQPDPTIESTKILAQVQSERNKLMAEQAQAKLQLENEKLQLANAQKTAELELQKLEFLLKAETSGQDSKNSQLDAVMGAIDTLHKMTNSGINA